MGRRAWCLAFAGFAAACGDAPPAPGTLPQMPPRTGTVIASGEDGPVLPDPTVAENPHLRALLAANPPRDEIERFHAIGLNEETDRRFFSTLIFLLDSKSTEVEWLAANALSDGYRVALTEKIDVERGIRRALASSTPSVRGQVVRNLANTLSPRAEAHVRTLLGDEGIDESAGEGRRVGDIAREALAPSEATNFAPLRGDGDLTRVDAVTGGTARGPLPGRPGIEVVFHEPLPELAWPEHQWMVSVQSTQGAEFATCSAPTDRPLSPSRLSSSNVKFVVWGRRTGPRTYRFWYRGVLEPGGR